MIKVTVWNEYLEELQYEHVARFIRMEFMNVFVSFWKRIRRFRFVV